MYVMQALAPPPNEENVRWLTSRELHTYQALEIPA